MAKPEEKLEVKHFDDDKVVFVLFKGSCKPFELDVKTLKQVSEKVHENLENGVGAKESKPWELFNFSSNTFFILINYNQYCSAGNIHDAVAHARAYFVAKDDIDGLKEVVCAARYFKLITLVDELELLLPKDKEVEPTRSPKVLD